MTFCWHCLCQVLADKIEAEIKNGNMLSFQKDMELHLFVKSFQPASQPVLLETSWRAVLVAWSLYWSCDLNGCHYPIVFPPTVPWVEGGAAATMPVDEYWLCLPASHLRPFVQTVRLMPSCPYCCWYPRALPPVPEPPGVPATLPLPRGSRCAVPLPAPSSSAPPPTSPASCSADPKLCPSPPTADGRQEKNVESGPVSFGTFVDYWD